jgi:hypothetical protein
VAKIKYDVSDVEEFTPYAGPTPRRGVYDGIVRTAEFGDSKAGNAQFTFTIVIDSKKKDQKEFNGCPLFQNCTIGDLTEDWQKRNLKMVINTFGLKDKGEIDPVALAKKLDGKNTRVRVLVKNENSEEYGLQAKANGLLPFKGEDAPEDDADAEDAEDAEDADAEETDDGLEEMNRTQLKAFIKEKELEVKVTKSKKDEDIVAEIREALAAAEDEDDEDEDEDDEDESSVEDDIKDLDRAGLKAYIKENELDVTVKKSMDDDAIRKAIIDAWPDEDDDEAADDGEPPF